MGGLLGRLDDAVSRTRPGHSIPGGYKSGGMISIAIAVTTKSTRAIRLV